MKIITSNEKKYQFSSSKFIFIFPILSSFSFLIYWINGGIPFAVLGIIFLFLPILVFEINTGFYVYYFLLPNIALFKLDTSGFALLSLYLAIVFIRLLFHSKLKINLSYFILLIVYLLISLISYFIEQTDLSIMTQEIRLVLDMFIVFHILKINDYNLVPFFDKISNAFILGTILSVVTGLLFILLEGINLDNFRFVAINSDPNDFSLNLAFSISLILLKIYYGKGKSQDLYIIFILTIFGSLSLSRGFLISMSLNLVFFIFIFFCTAKIKALLKIIFLFIMGLFIFNFRDLLNNLYLNIISRFISEETKGGSGRITIWFDFLDEITSNLKGLLIGLGKPLYIQEFDRQAVQHNLYLEIFTEKGIIGGLVVFCIYLSLFTELKLKLSVNKFTLISFIPLFTLAIGFMFLNALYSDIGIMKIFLGFFAIIVFSKRSITKISVNKTIPINLPLIENNR